MNKHSITNTDKGKHQDSQGYRGQDVVWGGVELFLFHFELFWNFREIGYNYV